MLKPYAAEVLVKELRKAVSLPIHLHTHDTSGIQSATLLKAIESGVHVVDVALASLSGLTSLPSPTSTYWPKPCAIRHTRPISTSTPSMPSPTIGRRSVNITILSNQA